MILVPVFVGGLRPIWMEKSPHPQAKSATCRDLAPRRGNWAPRSLLRGPWLSRMKPDSCQWDIPHLVLQWAGVSAGGWGGRGPGSAPCAWCSPCPSLDTTKPRPSQPLGTNPASKSRG